MEIKKRDGSLQPFSIEKIINAVTKAMEASMYTKGIEEIATKVAMKTESAVIDMCSDEDTETCIDGNPTVAEIQDLVEESLMDMKLFDVAKAYILYRNEKDKSRRRSLFKKRVALKPYEYPELYEYVDAIRHSYWVHTEFNYTSDVQDFRVNTTPAEREAIKRTMLAIAQIEVAVKTFWGDIYKKMPKPEIGSVGATFAESEVRHADAYAHLLELLGLNQEFEQLTNIPVIKERIEYLEQVISLSRTNENREYVEAVLLFSLFVEHVSLFSQFLVMMSFNKHKNLFKGISNAVEATSKEEQIHGMFGIDLINLVREEHPEWFDGEMRENIEALCMQALESESKIIDWIFEAGELDMLPKHVVKEFIKNRLNNSLEAIGFTPLFNVDEKAVEETDWFDNEVIATKHVDFFNKRSINYNKRSTSITGDDLFD